MYQYPNSTNPTPSSPNMPTTFPQFIPPTSGPTAHPTGPTMAVYVDAAPYPEVSGAPNPETVAMLKEDYAGRDSELTAITQYVFQSGRTTDNDSYANAVLQIGIVEMMHLDMLADAIVALGGSPTFDNGKEYWAANNVNYASDLKGMIEANIQGEGAAIKSYENHAAKTTNPSVKALLARIIIDEKLHLKFFQELLATL